MAGRRTIRAQIIRTAGMCAAAAWGVFNTGCASYSAYHARFHEPNYIVTDFMFEEAPKRVAVLPFATRTLKPKDQAKAKACRIVFFQHFSIRGFQDMEMIDIDESMLHDRKMPDPNMLNQLYGIIRYVDVVGMTSLLDLNTLIDRESIEYGDFRDWIEESHARANTDAYVLGVTRNYGRFYAVVVSSIALSTRVEMRSAETGRLLWRGETKKRNYSIPISLNPIDIPYLLYYTWINSRGLAMDMLAYQVYRDLIATIPYVPQPVDAHVKITRNRAPIFRKPTIWRYLNCGHLPNGTMMKFIFEKSGWYQCKDADQKLVWVFHTDAILCDENGNPIDTRSDCP